MHQLQRGLRVLCRVDKRDTVGVSRWSVQRSRLEQLPELYGGLRLWRGIQFLRADALRFWSVQLVRVDGVLALRPWFVRGCDRYKFVVVQRKLHRGLLLLSGVDDYDRSAVQPRKLQPIRGLQLLFLCRGDV